MSVIFNHIDWLGVFLSLFGWFLMAKKRFIALIILVLANVVWLIWGLETRVWSIFVLQSCFMVLNGRTMYEWFHIEQKKPPELQESSFKKLIRLINYLN
jgi:hypothetical protein